MKYRGWGTVRDNIRKFILSESLRMPSQQVLYCPLLTFVGSAGCLLTKLFATLCVYAGLCYPGKFLQGSGSNCLSAFVG